MIDIMTLCTKIYQKLGNCGSIVYGVMQDLNINSSIQHVVEAFWDCERTGQMDYDYVMQTLHVGPCSPCVTSIMQHFAESLKIPMLFGVSLVMRFLAHNLLFQGTASLMSVT